MGFIVDGVEEVLNLAAEDLEKTPDFGFQAPTEHLLGMANVKNKVIALLDIDHIVDTGAIEKINDLAAA
jgi:purine-binding chemotaxis protein CheW